MAGVKQSILSISSSIRQTTAWVTLALTAALVIAMAWPRLAASIQFLPVERAISNYFKSSDTQASEIDRLVAQSELAAAHFDRYSYHSALSLLYFLQATSSETPLHIRRERLDQSIAEARISLAAAPMQPDLWLRIVQAGMLAFLPPDELAQNYQMAIWSGRVEPTHLLQRVQLGMALERSLDQDGLILLRDQALLAWNLRQGDLVGAVRNGGLSRTRLESLLRESHPDVVADMEQVLGPVAP